jgi:hypothetical protein
VFHVLFISSLCYAQFISTLRYYNKPLVKIKYSETIAPLLKIGNLVAYAFSKSNNTCSNFKVRKSEEKKPLERPRRRWKNKIKVGWENGLDLSGSG